MKSIFEKKIVAMQCKQCISTTDTKCLDWCQLGNNQITRAYIFCFMSECYKQIPMYGVTGLSSVSVYKTSKRITLPQILLKLNLAKIKSIWPTILENAAARILCLIVLNENYNVFSIKYKGWVVSDKTKWQYIFYAINNIILAVILLNKCSILNCHVIPQHDKNLILKKKYISEHYHFILICSIVFVKIISF